MANTLDNNLRLELPDPGQDDNTWGDILNAMFTELERAITDVLALVVTGGTVALTTSGGEGEQARKAMISCTGTLTSNAEIQAPNEPKMYIIKNGTSGAFTLGIKTPSGATLDIPQGETHIVWNDPAAGGGNGAFSKINAEVSGTVSQATNALQLGGVVAANYAQLAVKQTWTAPQTLAVREATGVTDTPDADTDSTVRFPQSVVTGNLTVNNPTGTPVDGQILVVEVEQHGTTVRSITWGTKFVFSGDVNLDLTQTVDRVDGFAFQYNANLDRWLNKGAVQDLPRA